MKIALTGFRGEIPLLDPRLLPDNAAQVARNVYLKKGTLKPESAPGPASGLPTIINPTTLYRYPSGNDGKGFWLAWGSGKEVNAIKSPLADDNWKRVYWTGDGPPKMGGLDTITAGTGPYPGDSYALGLPAPASAPSAAAPAIRATEPPSTAVDTAYVVTFITGYGEEGPPSPASASITRWDDVEGNPDGGHVEVSLPIIPATDNDITTKRLYRVESGGVFQFVADLPAATGNYTDNIDSELLGLAVPSVYWSAPDPRMIGLTALTNGIMAGFFENTLAFCEAYRPHAWPTGYQLAFTDDIVAIASTSNGLIVGTTGRPRLVAGSSPEAMQPMELDSDQPCVSARSMVDMGEYAIYAGNDGLVAVGGSEAQVITAQIMSRDQWQALSPESIHAYRYDGRYLGFYPGGSFYFTPGQGFEFFDVTADHGYYDMADDVLYLIQGQNIVGWEQGEPMTLRYRSKLYEGYGGLSCAKVIASAYPVTFRLFADGALVHEQSVAGRRLFRLPAAGVDTREWEVEVEGTHEIQSIQVAPSPLDIV